MEQFGLKGGRPGDATHTKTMEDVAKGDGVDEAAIENERHHLTHHLHQVDATVFPSPLGFCDHSLPHGIFCQPAIPEALPN